MQCILNKVNDADLRKNFKIWTNFLKFNRKKFNLRNFKKFEEKFRKNLTKKVKLYQLSICCRVSYSFLPVASTIKFIYMFFPEI